MLGKIHSLFFRFFVLQHGLFLLVGLTSLALNQSASAVEFTSWVKVLVLFGIIFAWGYRRQAKNKEQFLRWQPIWFGMAQQYVAVRVLRLAYFSFSMLGLATMAFLFAYSSYCSSILTVSQCADRAGAYELAEWWYKQSPGFTRRKPLSACKSVFATEKKHERLLRNSAVARVYGADSLEIAQRFHFVGLNIQLNGCGSRVANDEAFSWFEKSFAIARAHNYWGMALENLCQMAMVKCPDNVSQGHAYILQACDLVSRYPHASSDMSDVSRGQFRSLAGLTGDQTLAKTFKDPPIQMKSHKGFLDATKIAILFALAIVPSVFARLGLVSPLFAEILVAVLHYRARKRLMKSANLNTSMTTLNILIDLDLYRGNYRGALKHSEHLLQLASIGVISSESTKTGFKWHNRVGLLLGQQILAMTAFFVLYRILVR